MTDPTFFMRRCLQLARLGAHAVAPNPMVGAVLMHEDRIIGEGWHRAYGGPHAEVHCIESVQPKDRHLIAESTLFVSLEPCAHFGKTPPCADFVIRHRIPNVVVGCRDPFAEVDGKGIEKMRAEGIDVTVGLLEEECREINRRFFTFHTAHRPYVVLKWAQSADGRITTGDRGRVRISNTHSDRLVHKWRSEEAGIVVGTNTALLDDPALTTRLWPGRQPVRIVVDRELRLPLELKLFDGSVPTVVFNHHQHTLTAEGTLPADAVGYYQIGSDASLVDQMLNGLYRMRINSILVEGGTQLLQSFIDAGLWDEARVITNDSLFLGEGLPAPQLGEVLPVERIRFHDDTICTWRPKLH